jgi:DNA processing protein
MDERSAWLILARAPQLSVALLKQLLAVHGTPLALLRASPAGLQAAGATRVLAHWLTQNHTAAIDADLRWLEQPSHHLIVWGSPEYPFLLEQLADAPPVLFVAGDAQCLRAPQLAIVGSRSPSPGGRDTARSFARHLAACGAVITSGLAIGIDSASHEGALAAPGKTIAVCACGLDRTYPSSNIALAEAITAAGAVVSEFPIGTPPIKHNFPRRNRIISGLSVGTLVVEAAVRSGSLITARLAAEQGREVFAIPGSIHNPMSQGCHQLIRQGAKLVETLDDILSELGPLLAFFPEGSSSLSARAGLTTDPAATRPSKRSNPKDSQDLSRQPAKNPRAALDKAYEMLLDALSFEPVSIDLLVARTGLAAEAIAAMLLSLELDGYVAAAPGGLYLRLMVSAHT